LRSISDAVAQEVKNDGSSLSSVKLVEPKGGTLLDQIDFAKQAGDVLSIPRETLRGIFLRNLIDNDKILQWNDPVVYLKNIEQQEDGGKRYGVELRSEKKKNEPKVHDVVVGCDGLHSIVRERLFYSLRQEGIDIVHRHSVQGIAGVTKNYKRFLPDAFHGCLTNVFADKEAVIMSLLTFKDLVYWQLVFPSSEPMGVPDNTEPKALHGEAVRAIKDWYPPFVDVVADALDETIRRKDLCDREPLSARDLARRDLKQTVVIGDALHPLCPFVGGFGETTNATLVEVSRLCETLEPYMTGQKDGEALDHDLGALQVSMADWRLPLWTDAREIAVRVATSAFG